jgi:sulfatase modifying factor 1
MPSPNQWLIEAPGSGGCLPGMVAVEGFCIDRYEASLVRVNGGDAISPFFNPGVEEVRAVSIQGAVPQGYIDQIQATSACLASGKRLCTNVEWLRACQGSKATIYPYGNVLEPGICNDERSVHPAVEYFGTTSTSIFSHLDNACLNQLPGSLDSAGARSGCETADGAFDMMGNVHEWTADPAGTFRGGYYMDTVKNGSGCLYATTAHTTSHWDYSTGFRCCADLP